MRGKMIIRGNHYFHNSARIKCWTPVNKRKQDILKRLLRKYQKEIDTTLAMVAIGFMFVIGVWCFLVQLAEY